MIETFNISIGEFYFVNIRTSFLPCQLNDPQQFSHIDRKLSVCEIFRSKSGNASLNKFKEDGELIEALARGLAVIECFDADQPEMTLSEVAKKTDITPATARRILRTLVVLGYARNVNKRFLLTPKALGLGAAYARSAQLEEALMPELRRLVGIYGDASSVTVLSGTDVLYIAHYSDQKARRISAGAGVTYPAYPTSMGRVLLSGLSEGELDQYLSQGSFEQRTEHTVIDPDELKKIIQKTRKQGYSTSTDELFYGVTAIAVPIMAVPGEVIAAINSSGYSGGVTADDLISDRLEDLRISADRIGETLMRFPALRHSINR
ncbi:MAG: helix-turn-helix domain-containing protein [Rhizobiaceae bacterium]|nr:helix-turn-helix domain-containing protein [Rhizobiaceae bacterium]